MLRLTHMKALALASIAAAGSLAMTSIAAAQTTKYDADTTKKFEAAQKAETTSAKGQWEPSTPFPMPMEEPVGVVVDGKLYIIQGLTDGGFQPMGVVYAYDPATKAWTKKARSTARSTYMAASCGPAGTSPGNR
jgi:hypothetical protein